MLENAKRGLAAFLLAGMLACGEDSTDVQIKGTVDACVVAGGCSSFVAAMPVGPPDLTGRIIVMAVDADANVRQASTGADGSFSMSVSSGRSYVMMFRDSANRFLGTLVVNQDENAGTLRADADLDLGTITLEPELGLASSSNAAALAKVATATMPPEASVKTTRVSFSSYDPMEPGMVRYSKGYGTAEPGSAAALEERLTKFTVEYLGALGRDVLVQWNYRLDAGCTPAHSAGCWVLNDKLYKYITDRELCEYQKQISADEYEVVNWCGPDVVTVGETITTGTPPEQLQLRVERIVPELVLPDLDSTARSGMAVYVKEGTKERFSWYADGIGEGLFTTTLDALPTTPGETTGIRMRLLCVLPSDSSATGTCPSWFTPTLVNALPTTFGVQG